MQADFLSLSCSSFLNNLHLFYYLAVTIRRSPERDHTNEDEMEDLELPLFEFDTIAEATDNFSSSNKLGQGGFGPVYKVSILYGFFFFGINKFLSPLGLEPGTITNLLIPLSLEQSMLDGFSC